LINPGETSATGRKKAKTATKSAPAAKRKKAGASGKKAAGKRKPGGRPVQTPAVRIESGVASQ
jgi:hypothetical protein